MAEEFTKFSCVLDVESDEQAQHAEKIFADFTLGLAGYDGSSPCFQLERIAEAGPGALWIHSKNHGSPENVVRFVKLVSKALDLHGVWGFRWGHSHRRPRADNSGGGA